MLGNCLGFSLQRATAVNNERWYTLWRKSNAYDYYEILIKYYDRNQDYISLYSKRFGRGRIGGVLTEN